MAKIKTILLEEELVSILDQCGPALTNVLHSKFGCTAVLHGVGTGAGKFKKPGEERFSTQLSKGLKVSVWKDDLTTHKVDAVVNAANVNLSHGGGLACALCDAGGPDIQQESDQYRKRHGKLLTGNAIVAKPGRLPCKKIIHAVGPHLPHQPMQYQVDNAKPELSKTVISILKMVEQEKLQSVAIPAISSGLFNFPLPTCADVIVQTLKMYHDQYYSGATLEVRLVNHDERTVREMERACIQILGFSGSHSQAASAKRQAPYSQDVTSYGKSSIKPLTPTVQLGNVSLTIKKGNIEEEKVDVIVNTTQQDLKLAVGEISKALSQKAGSEIQKEIRKTHTNVSNGAIIETKGYKLNCSSVYHTVCAQRHEYSADKILYNVVLECLRMAETSGRRSISFPAIGTGNLGFRKQEVAKIMTDAVVAAAQNLQEMTMDIYIVVYPSDKDTFQAFEDQLKSHQDTMKYPSSSNSASSHGFGHATDQYESRAPNKHRSPRGGATPHIELSSAYSDTLREATFWLTFIMSSDSFTIHNNFIQCFGQTEFDELLSFQTKWKVSIKENLKDGCASITIQGASRGIGAAVLEVEAMCCKVQEDFAKELENLMGLKSPTSSPRKPVDDNSLEHREIQRRFSGFLIVRVEKVENHALRQLFDLKKLQVSTSPQQMYQRLPAQFCDLLSRVGFQKEFAPPDEQKLGKGIYFSSSVSGAEKLWQKSFADEEYLYFVEAEVLTGNSTAGSPDLIVPPPFGRDPLTLYDSVEEGLATFVVFNGHQALPKYLITCKKHS